MKRPGLLLLIIFVLLALMGWMVYMAVSTHRFPSGARLVCDVPPVNRIL